MNGGGVSAKLFAPLNRWSGAPVGLPVVTGGISNRIDGHLPYRFVGPTVMHRAEKRLLNSLGREKPEVVFTWGEVSLEVSRAVHERGVPVVREKFNCGKRMAKSILDKAYSDVGGGPTHAITEALIEKEEQELRLADAIFCPSPFVRKSLLDIGIPPERLLDSSYGWEPARFQGSDRALEAVDGPTVLFVGYVCVRKGAHILLQAWERAGIKGRLVLVGDIEPTIAERYRAVLARPDVVYVPYTSNIGAYFRSADWFIFPSLEEGGPQVTYEAAGLGVPVIVSPMGAGAFARDGLEGIVVDSDQPEPWTEVLASLPDRARERPEFAQRAQAHAMEFTYEKVGARRREILRSRFAAADAAPQLLAKTA
jgi:glycosyltransferase involved in cell wall biosynthesis